MNNQGKGLVKGSDLSLYIDNKCFLFARLLISVPLWNIATDHGVVIASEARFLRRMISHEKGLVSEASAVVFGCGGCVILEALGLL